MRSWYAPKPLASYDIAITVVALSFASCAGDLPTVDEVNETVLTLRQYGSWAWAGGIALICADLLLPVPQSSVVTALGIIYGVAIGGVVGAVGMITAGMLPYGLMRTSARPLIVRLAGEPALSRMQVFFERAGAWAVVLTRSLPYSVPEAIVCLAGLAGMPLRKFFLAMVLGSVPAAFVFAWIGAGWADQPLVALVISYVVPILMLPLVLHLLRRQRRD
jgi:uncharacterized membrane protein YdjX (TVP38/TMEM64 family)